MIPIIGYYIVSVHKVDILTPSPTPPLKVGAIILPSPLKGEGKGEGEGEGEGEQQSMDRLYIATYPLNVYPGVSGACWFHFPKFWILDIIL